VVYFSKYPVAKSSHAPPKSRLFVICNPRPLISFSLDRYWSRWSGVDEGQPKGASREQQYLSERFPIICHTGHDVTARRLSGQYMSLADLLLAKRGQLSAY